MRASRAEPADTMATSRYPGSKHQWALLYVVLASVLASVFAPILGGFIEAYLHWRWVFWISLMFNFGTLAAFAVFVPETRPEVMLDNQARQFRKQGRNIWGPREVKGTFRERISLKHIATLMWRPYYMLLKEPIVMALSLLSGFSDTLICKSSYPITTSITLSNTTDQSQTSVSTPSAW